MKKQTQTTKGLKLIFTIPFLIAFALSILFSGYDAKNSSLNRHFKSDISNTEQAHKCYDSSHINCDGYCKCDGLGCPED